MLHKVHSLVVILERTTLSRRSRQVMNMSENRAEYRERVVRTVDYNTGGSAPDALDADHIRVHLCANAQYAVDDINRAIADALEAGELVEVKGGYVVVDDV